MKKKKYNIKDEMNLFDEAKWVEKVITSCKIRKQLYPTYSYLNANIEIKLITL